VIPLLTSWVPQCRRPWWVKGKAPRAPGYDITLKGNDFAVRPEGACIQWREDPPRELSIALVADERFGRATGWIEAS
jgi:hypothetical protein